MIDAEEHIKAVNRALAQGNIDVHNFELEDYFPSGFHPHLNMPSNEIKFSVDDNSEVVLNNEPTEEELVAMMANELEEYTEEEMIADYENPALERHRLKLKLGEIPYKVAYSKGMFSKSGKNPYRKDTRMWKAFEAGKRVRD